jgi:nucleosome binding factor SPN SPT16 subunit
MAGKFVTEWQNLLQSAQVDFKEIDVAAGVSALLAAKDSEELVRFAGHHLLLLLLLLLLLFPSVLKRREH